MGRRFAIEAVLRETPSIRTMSGLGNPADPEAITAAWLTNALRESGTLTGATVASLDWTPLNRGRLSRIVRIRPRYIPADAAAPASIIGKFRLQNAALRDLVTPMVAVETRFYQHIAPDSDLITPPCFHIHHDVHSSVYILLIEDLKIAHRGFEGDDITPDDAEIVVRQIAAFHAAWWGSEELNRATCFDQLNNSEHTAIREPGLPGLLSNRRSIEPEAQESVERDYGLVRDRLSNGPLTLVLDDLHIGNLFRNLSAAKPSVTFIDFQFVCLARGPIDVARLLAGSLTTEARRAVEARILAKYYVVLLDGGVTNYTYKDCLQDYRLGLLWGLLRLTTNNLVMTAIAVDPPSGARTELTRQIQRFSTAVDDLGCREFLRS